MGIMAYSLLWVMQEIYTINRMEPMGRLRVRNLG